jgi:hypothetical protein
MIDREQTTLSWYDAKTAWSVRIPLARYPVDPQTGEISTFASGLPKEVVGLDGAIDAAFIGDTAYALVTLVGEDVGATDTVGIYRVDGPDSFTVPGLNGTQIRPLHGNKYPIPLG